MLYLLLLDRAEPEGPLLVLWDWRNVIAMDSLAVWVHGRVLDWWEGRILGCFDER